MPQLDLNFVRSQFPAFSEPSLEGWGYFDNAGGSYTCKQVIDRLMTFYTQTKIQPDASSLSPASRAGGIAMNESYEQMAAYLNVGVDEVHFGPSTSQNTYVLSHALRGMWEDRDEIIVSNQDHEANAGAWRRMADTGIVVKEWLINPETGHLDSADLHALITDKTRMIAFPHASNVVAETNPVAEVAKIAHAAGAICVADGVAQAPHGIPDVKALGADIYMFSLYKTWGPHLGIMTVKRELLDKMTNQSHYFNDGKVRSMLLPAGPDHAQFAAAAGVAQYMDAVYAHHFDDFDSTPAVERGRKVHDLFETHEKALLTKLMGWLSARDDVQIVGTADPELRAPTVAFIPLKKKHKQVLQTLADHKIIAKSGDFYGVRPLMGMNIPLDPGVVRVSFIHYTTEGEIDQLIGGIKAALD